MSKMLSSTLLRKSTKIFRMAGEWTMIETLVSLAFRSASNVQYISNINNRTLRRVVQNINRSVNCFSMYPRIDLYVYARKPIKVDLIDISKREVTSTCLDHALFSPCGVNYAQFLRDSEQFSGWLLEAWLTLTIG